MFQAQPTAASEPRRGVILMIVLILLTLFAIVGLSFALYADAQAKSAQIGREAEVQTRPEIEPEELFSYFMGQLAYDTDNQNGVYSALRGHSLGRSIFGYNDTPTFTNLVPFNGPGRIHATTNPLGIDDYLLVNYTYFAGDNFVHDPERMGVRANPSAPYGPTNAYFGVNVPYTYTDLNNMFLAAVKPDGTVLIPSFHRPWLFGAIDPTSQPGGSNPNPNWTNVAGKYLFLGPRPADMGPGFPYPEDAGGYVKNLIGAPGGNDSIWIDLGFPVMQAPNGKKFKPLFAPLIIDLDNRINLNVHGNILGYTRSGGTATPPHVSNQSWGPWSINLGLVMNQPNSAGNPEWPQLFLRQTGPTVYGRYGPDMSPSSAPNNILTPFYYPSGALPPPPHFYSLIDLDGSADNGTATPPLTPNPPAPLTPAGAAPYSCFPAYATGALGYGNGSLTELTSHPGVYNTFQPTGDDRAFPLSNMEALLRYGQTGSPFLTSELLRLCPSNLLGSDPTIRNRVTLRSFDFDVPGVAPWVWQQQTPPAPYQLARTDPLPQYPKGNPIGFPAPGTAAALVPPTTDFGGTAVQPDWRALTAALGRLDLNRPLPNYPDPVAGQITDLAGFQAAQFARQRLAQDIFNVLFQTMGMNPAILATPGTADYDAARWLAQLAVNIVDFIDTDDYITPWNWNGADWVFGTELPRVLINEAFAVYSWASGTTTVKVWAELYNSFNNNDPTLITPPGGTSGGDAPLAPAATIPAAYQIALCNPNLAYYRRADNVWGTPYPITAGDTDQSITLSGGLPPLASPGQSLPTGPTGDAGVGGLPGTTPWGTPPQVISTSNGASGPAGYYLVGPEPLPGTGGPPLDNTQTSMKYQFTAASNMAPPAPTVLLQRLACPYLPYQNTPTLPQYNPYITVDFMQDVDIDATTNLVTTNNNANPPNVATNMQTDGRTQPYYGYSLPNRTAGKQLTTLAVANQPKHTFKALNSQVANYPNGPGNFSWPVHLDRQLASPMELLHVSALKPHELTQEFINPNGLLQPFNHRVPWFDEDINPPGSASHRLYRFFEFATTRSRAAGLAAPTIQSPQPVTVPGGGVATPFIVSVPTLSGLTTSGVPVSIQVGSVLIFDGPSVAGQPDPREHVVVTAVNPTATPLPTFTANFYKSHNPNVPITLTVSGDRIPGKININTMWEDPTDPRTLSAVCDAQSSNNFAQTDVTTIYNQLITLRNPGGAGVISGNDVPFWGSATGLYPTGDPQFASPPGTGAGYSINNTLLRALTAGSAQRLFQVPSPDPTPNTTTPYVKYQLLNKIFNNITTRSNVFAVWVTVGFFEVTDDTVRPVKLGAEIGRSENRNIRHRMFAIVDRTRLTVPSAITTLTAAVSPGNQTVAVGALTNTITTSSGTIPWTIQPGSYVVIDYGTTNQETVWITGTAAGPPAAIQADFTRPHSAGATVSVIVVPGNPGPQTRFNVHDPYYQAVVPYFSIIQ